MGWGESIAPFADLTVFEREVLVEALRSYLNAGGPTRDLTDRDLVQARRLAVARDLELRLS